MNNTTLCGTGVALITPFDEAGEVDYNALDALIEYDITNGVNFLVVFGTTGEPVTMTDDEKQKVLLFIKEKVNNRIPLVVGCGGNNTLAVLENLKTGIYDGFDAILSVSPYYNKPSQEGIIKHYTAIADASPVPVILYNVPGRTGANISVETVTALSAHENIIGLKEASPSVEQFTYIKRSVPADFLLFSGDDSLLLPHMSLGAAGAISVTANVMPAIYSQIVSLALEGKYAEALPLHLKLIEFTDSLFEEGSPAGVKAALAHLGIIKNVVRLPLTVASEALQDKIAALLKELQK